MEWNGDIGLELYIATKRYGNRQQYIDSQMTLLAISQYGLLDRVKVTPLNSLNGQREFFDSIKDPTTKTRLPFLVCVHGCETGAVLGYSGLEEVLDVLNITAFVNVAEHYIFILIHHMCCCWCFNYYNRAYEA